MARNGKIAHLSHEVREALNRRLQDGEQGGAVPARLNALPEVQAVVKREFDGWPVSKQNLYQWRSGGFVEWQARQEVFAQAQKLARNATELAAMAEGKLTDHLATTLAARYAAALYHWDGEVTEEFQRMVQALSGLCRDIVGLRRGDHKVMRLKIEQDRLGLAASSELPAKPDEIG